MKSYLTIFYDKFSKDFFKILTCYKSNKVILFENKKYNYIEIDVSLKSKGFFNKSNRFLREGNLKKFIKKFEVNGY